MANDRQRGANGPIEDIDRLLADFAPYLDSKNSCDEIGKRLAEFLATDTGRTFVTQVASSALLIIGSTAHEWSLRRTRQKLVDDFRKDFGDGGRAHRPHAQSSMLADLRAANDENERKLEVQKLKELTNELLAALKSAKGPAPKSGNRERRKGG